MEYYRVENMPQSLVSDTQKAGLSEVCGLVRSIGDGIGTQTGGWLSQILLDQVRSEACLPGLHTKATCDQ